MSEKTIHIPNLGGVDLTPEAVAARRDALLADAVRRSGAVRPGCEAQAVEVLRDRFTLLLSYSAPPALAALASDRPAGEVLAEALAAPELAHVRPPAPDSRVEKLRAIVAEHSIPSPMRGQPVAPGLKGDYSGRTDQ